MAATLYIEMKKSLKTRNLQTFSEGATIIKKMLKEGKLPCSGEEFLKTLASHSDSEGRNLLHEAALAALDDEPRFFNTLLRLKFPLYGEDTNLDFAGFYICMARTDAIFSNCLGALAHARFDVNKENDDNETFL